MDRGNVLAYVNKDNRAESLAKLAEHLRSHKLVPIERVRDRVPKGFNQNKPLDKVTIAVGENMI